jgi:hypothetical protein
LWLVVRLRRWQRTERENVVCATLDSTRCRAPRLPRRGLQVLGPGQPGGSSSVRPSRVAQHVAEVSYP